MVAFEYIAVDRFGTKKAGSISARDRSDALRQLSARGLQPLNLQAGEGDQKKPSPKKNAEKTTEHRLGNLTRVRLTGNQLIAFTDEIGDLLNAGIQLEPALKLMEGREDLVTVGKIAEKVRMEIRDGTSFSRALAKASPSFDSLYLNLVAAGEASGSLPQLLTRHTSYLTKVQELKGKIVTAMIYPAFLIFAGAIVTVMFITFLIPRLTMLIESTGSSLPKGVQLISATSILIKNYWWAFLIGLVVVFALFKLVTSANRKTWDRGKLGLPVLGKMIRARFQVHFLRTLGNLLGNGLSLVDSLKLTKGITTNKFLQEQMEEITNEVIDGSSLHSSLRKRRGFPPSLADYVKISEQTGHLDLGIQKAAEKSEKSLEKDIERISTMIQPIIILAMAAVIGTMAYMMIAVIYDTIEILRTG